MQYSLQSYKKSVRLEEKDYILINSESTHSKLSNDVLGVYFGQIVMNKERFEFWEDRKS